MNRLFSLFFLAFIFLGSLAYAQRADARFERDLFYGIRNDPDVRALQEFLSDQGVYNGAATGNFFMLTKEAVIKSQEQEGIRPLSGYFGVKSRARANNIGASRAGKEEMKARLSIELAALQEKLRALQEASLRDTEPQAASSTQSESPAFLPVGIATTTPSAESDTATTTMPASEVRLSGESVTPFPGTRISPLKVGDIAVTNHTEESFSFAQLEVNVLDAMDSPTNRNRTVIFLLRNGTSSADAILSSTNFQFDDRPPAVGSLHKRQLKLSFPVIITPGTERSFGLWVEQLDYVAQGSLTITFSKAEVYTAQPLAGSFSLALTRISP